MASNDVDLLFSKPQPDGGMPVELVFGDDDTGHEIPVVLVQAAGRITGLRLPLLVRPCVRAQAGGRITGLRQSIGARYDVNTARPLVSLTQAAFQAAQPVAAGATSRHSGAHTERAGALTRWQAAGQQSSLVRTAWQATKQLQRGVATAWQQGRQLHVDQVQLRWQTAQAVSAAAAARYQQGLDLAADQVLSCHQDAWRDRLAAVATRHQDAANHLGVAAGQPLGNAGQIVLLSHARHQDAWVPRIGTSRPPTPPGPQPCYVPALPVELLFDQMADSSQPVNLVFVCERHGPGPQPVETIVVPVRRVYVVINEARLRRVDGDIQIPTFTMSMSLDADSWTWSFSASVPGYALADIEPEDGVPVAVQATINGTPYRFIVESIARERTFGRSDLRIGGRGRAAVLDAPYAPIMSFSNEFNRTAQQIMNDILVDNGVPLGWDVEWNPDDWNVPAGVFNHQGSYISALNQVAGSISAYLQPHNTDEVLRVLSRYPVAPWDWAGVTPDFELPSAVMSRESIEWRDKPRYNRVYVMGQQAGVNGRVTRAGTAGDYLAPSVVDPLITQAVAARQRGIAVLSDTGRIATVGLRLPVLAETGIIKPGSFVKYTDGGTQRIGITRSVQVEVGLPAIWQTLGVETHVEPI